MRFAEPHGKNREQRHKPRRTADAQLGEHQVWHDGVGHPVVQIAQRPNQCRCAKPQVRRLAAIAPADQQYKNRHGNVDNDGGGSAFCLPETARAPRIEQIVVLTQPHGCQPTAVACIPHCQYPQLSRRPGIRLQQVREKLQQLGGVEMPGHRGVHATGSAHASAIEPQLGIHPRGRQIHCGSAPSGSLDWRSQDGWKRNCPLGSSYSRAFP